MMTRSECKTMVDKDSVHLNQYHAAMLSTLLRMEKLLKRLLATNEAAAPTHETAVKTAQSKRAELAVAAMAEQTLRTETAVDALKRYNPEYSDSDRKMDDTMRDMIFDETAPHSPTPVPVFYTAEPAPACDPAEPMTAADGTVEYVEWAPVPTTVHPDPVGYNAPGWTDEPDEPAYPRRKRSDRVCIFPDEEVPF